MLQRLSRSHIEAFPRMLVHRVLLHACSSNVYIDDRRMPLVKQAMIVVSARDERGSISLACVGLFASAFNPPLFTIVWLGIGCPLP